MQTIHQQKMTIGRPVWHAAVFSSEGERSGFLDIVHCICQTCAVQNSIAIRRPRKLLTMAGGNNGFMTIHTAHHQLDSQLLCVLSGISSGSVLDSIEKEGISVAWL